MDLTSEVLKWGEERGLLVKGNQHKQLLKTFEEIGELASAVLCDDKEKIKDSIGDALVTLILFSSMYNLTLHECLQYAYNEIKDRKGKTINGHFIKD